METSWSSSRRWPAADVVPQAQSGLPELTAAEIRRYSRHLIMPEVTIAGQRKLKAASVLLVGAGGLGSPLALYLAAAGVGRLGLVDFDVVDLSNLQRQVLHGTPDIGRTKLESARQRIAHINPHVQVDSHETRLTSANALGIIGDYDIVADGTDNFATRYLVNDACVLLDRPNVYGSIFRFDGQVSVFATAGGPCYRCVYRQPPPPGMVPSCAEGGVLGVLAGLVGVIQATEVIKLVLGAGDSLVGRLLLVDALGMTFRTMRLTPDPACPACGTREIEELIDYEEFCGMTGSAPTDSYVPEIDPSDLAQRLKGPDDIELIDVREPHEWEISRISGARLIPLDGLAQSLHTIGQDRDLVCYCRNGVRSAAAVTQLQAAGFARVWSLAGGIARWSDEVDATVPKY
ncbi:MAG: molybdopterin-synthase adenylyltransferase MoeB [Gemmatimonadota bacterium]|nr:MAG: molybdopterin-synthase adenylyltransferase MoeB [Gemmatimonadota bacterium]